MDHRESISATTHDLILPGGGGEYAFRYALLPRERIATSHRRAVGRLVRNADYPSRLQHRAYSGRRAHSLDSVFLAGAKDLDPRQLLDRTLSTALGPPVVARRRRPRPAADDFVCVVGNHRVLITDFANEDFREKLNLYVDVLEGRLRQFDVPEVPLRDWDRPLLVRVLDDWILDPADERRQARVLAELGHINRLSDASFTKARDPASLGFVYARELLALGGGAAGRAIIEWMVAALREHRSVGAMLERSAGTRLLMLLVAHDVVPREELMLFQRPADERLTAFGTLCLRCMLYALAFDDAEIVDGSDPQLLQRLEASLGHLIALRGQGDWDIAPHVGRACLLVGKLDRPFAARRQTSASGRRTHFADLVTVSTLNDSDFFADATAEDVGERRALAYARAFAAIFLCEPQQGWRALASRFAEWRSRAVTPAGQLSLDGVTVPVLSIADEVTRVFCRNPDVAAWVTQQLRPPYDPFASPAQPAAPKRVHRTVRSSADAAMAYQHARRIWHRLVASLPAHVRRVLSDGARESGARARGRPVAHADAAVFAAWILRMLTGTAAAEVIVGAHAGPSARQCRRRVRAWQDHPELWSAIRAAAPAIARNEESRVKHTTKGGRGTRRAKNTSE